MMRCPRPSPSRPESKPRLKTKIRARTRAYARLHPGRCTWTRAGRKSLPMCSSRIQQDIPLVQIERYFLQAPALGHDRSRAPAALGGGGRTTSSRQWVRRVNTSRIIRIAAGRGPVTQGLNDQSSSNSPGERAGAACAILGSFQSGPYHVAWRFSFPFIQLDRKGL